MISLTIKGCCNECEHIDLNLSNFYFGPHKIYQLHCSHENVCGKLENERAKHEWLAATKGDD